MPVQFVELTEDEEALVLATLDPRYCDVIVRRWEEATGRAAERIRPSKTGA